MRIVDIGRGSPIVMIPGIQGRWEWMKPAVDALAQRCRVITFSLADERTAGCSFDAANGFDCYVEQVRAAMDQADRDVGAVEPGQPATSKITPSLAPCRTFTTPLSPCGRRLRNPPA